jgi:outer membrane lipoprotein-sorting protein
MSKLCPGIIRTIITTALVAITSAAHAQPAPPVVSPAPAPSTKPQTPAVIVPTTAPAKQDLKLLSKAAGIFWQTDRSETESKVLLRGTKDGITINSTMQLKTIVQTGGKFRSQLTIALIGSTVKATYVIVSNGRDVWIHRPDRNEYTKTTVTAFDDNRIFIGISSFMFLSVNEKNRQELITSLGTDQDLILNLNLPKQNNLQLKIRQIDGMNLSAYSFDMGKAKADVFLSPENANLHKVEFSSQETSLDMLFSETIINRNSQVNITDRTFTFTPPKGTKKVKSIKIELVAL